MVGDEDGGRRRGGAARRREDGLLGVLDALDADEQARLSAAHLRRALLDRGPARHEPPRPARPAPTPAPAPAPGVPRRHRPVGRCGRAVTGCRAA